jgi:hypothetical protein
MSAVFFDLSALDRAWAGVDAPAFVTTQWTPFAVNGELWVGRHIPAFDYVETAQARSAALESGGMRTQLETTFAEISYGYAALHHRSGVSIIPRAGVAMVNATVTAQPTGAVDFSALTADPRLVARMSKSAFVADLGAMFTYLISFGPRDALGIGSGIRIGVRVGALIQMFDLGPQRQAWKAGPEPVTGAPDVRLDGGFVRFFVAPSLLHRSAKPAKKKTKKRGSSKRGGR